MFLQFSGLSLIIHLLIILFAKCYNAVRGKSNIDSAFQTYEKNGGMVRGVIMNRILSILILLFISTYMFVLTGIAIITATSMGADEPQVIAYREFAVLIWVALTYLLMQTGFVYLIGGLVLLLIGAWYMPPVSVLWPRYKTFLQTLLATFAIKHTFNVLNSFIPKFMLVSNFNFKGLRKPALQELPNVPPQKVARFQGTIAIPLLAGMVVAACLFLLPFFARAQIVEPGFESVVVTDGLSLATTLAFTPDGRILVAEKSGTIKIIKNGVLQPQPVVILSDVNTFGDRGLIGLAVDPNFIQNGFIYVSYTYENSPGVNIGGAKTGRIVRLTMVGDTADESSKFVLVGTVGGSAASSSCENFVVTAD